MSNVPDQLPYPFIVPNFTGLPVRLPAPFAPGVTAEHPPGHCQCAWTWTPSRGGPDRPFAMKFWNRSCPVRHEFPRPAR